EGYLDVITAHQFGISNAVAALGTAMTEDHARLIRRYTNNVILALDADPAGIKAALRGLDILQAAGLHVRVAPVPDGKDPDEYIRRFGADAFRKLLSDKAMTLVQFKMAQAADKYDLTTITGKTSALAEVLPNLDQVRSDVEREEYLHILGQELNLSWDTIMSELRKYRTNRNNLKASRDKNVKNRNNNIGHANSAQPVPQAQPDGRQKAEMTLLRLALENNENLEYVENNLGDRGFREPGLNKILAAARQQVSTKGSCYPPDLYAQLGETEASLLSRVLMLEVPMGNLRETMEGCLRTVQGAEAGDRKGQLLKELAEAEKVGDWQLVAQLMTEYKELFNQ
ncbi:MAG TPA: toprim domain-containing protein, partial [Bacillota bacterium]|nr:toprim domain-containing protein [Bacillota bacterium]